MGKEIYGFGYKRLSQEDRGKKKEEQETSLQNQDDLIRKTFSKNKIILKNMFEDRYLSGSDRNRKDFNDMIKRAIDGEACIIGVKNRSRFCRDAPFFQKIMKDLMAYNVKVLSCVDNRYLDPESIEDDFGSVIDGRAIKEGRKNTKLLFNQKMEAKLPCIQAPFGYRYKRKKWFIVEEDAEIVRKIFELASKGNTMTSICKELGINKGKYYRVVGNKCYCGYVQYFNKIKDGENKVVRKEEVCYKGIHEPIISLKLFEKVQDILNSRREILTPNYSNL